MARDLDGRGTKLMLWMANRFWQLSREQKKLVEQLGEATEASPRVGLGVS